MNAARCALFVVLTGWCLSDSSGQDSQTLPSSEPRVAHQWLPSSPAEKQIAALIFGLAHNEIEIAKFAQSRLQTEMTRQFAAKMVREHTPGSETMKRIAGELAAQGEALGSARHRTDVDAATTARRPDPSPATDPPASAAASGAPDWLQIHQRIEALRLASTTRELSGQEGTNFDKGFMVQQVLAHQHAIDTLQALRRHATAELRRHIDAELQMASAHVQQARQIEQQLEGAGAVRTTRRP